MSAVQEFRTADDALADAAPQGSPAVLEAASASASTAPRLPGQLIRFASIGVASTVAYLVLYLLLRPLGAQPANAIALLITAIANTAANRRLTFAVRGSRRLVRNHVQGLAVFGLGLGVTSGALALMHAVSQTPGRLWEVAVLVSANGAATLVRFVLLRFWVFTR